MSGLADRAAGGAQAGECSATPARILSVNVGVARLLRAGQRTVLSGIRKMPVQAPVAARPLGLEGDEQADPSVHGGLQKAVYAYPSEHLPYWRAARRAAGAGLFDEVLPPGFMGENLTVVGLLEAEVWIGDTLRVAGSACVLRVTAPREPCGKFTAVMGLRDAAQRMVREARCGFYLAVEVPGELQAGAALQQVAGPRRLSVAQAIQAKWARHRNG
jgi:MOSC domain-containing protein YiiM